MPLVLAKGLTPLQGLILDGKRKQSHKNSATTKMNTIIYVKNPKGKNYGLSLRIGEGFTMMESIKGYNALRHTRLRQLL